MSKAAIVRVKRNYGESEITHTVFEGGPEMAIKIEMPLEPFVCAVVDRVIADTLAAVGAPAAILLRSTLASKVHQGLADRIQTALEFEIKKMKDSTVYKAGE